jgi:hypothetical protein
VIVVSGISSKTKTVQRTTQFCAPQSTLTHGKRFNIQQSRKLLLISFVWPFTSNNVNKAKGAVIHNFNYDLNLMLPRHDNQ